MVAVRRTPQKPYQLLIADDDSGFRDTLKDIFEPHFRLLEAESGEAAVRIVEGERVDIALLDMHMEVLTGLETLRILKTINSISPCILITADADEQLCRDATEADAYSVLHKPVRKADLVSTVAGALEEVYHDSFGLDDD